MSLRVTNCCAGTVIRQYIQQQLGVLLSVQLLLLLFVPLTDVQQRVDGRRQLQQLLYVVWCLLGTPAPWV